MGDRKCGHLKGFDREAEPARDGAGKLCFHLDPNAENELTLKTLLNPTRTSISR
jgi:hypothetical protein